MASINSKEWDAIGLQNKADDLRKQYENDKYRKPELSNNVFNAYVDAAEKWVALGNSSRAIICYEKAMLYGSKEKKESALEELTSLKRIPLSKPKQRAIYPTKKSSGLEDLWVFPFGILSLFLLVCSLFFASVSITGNVIGGIIPNNSRIIGLCLFVCGLVFTFISLKRSK